MHCREKISALRHLFLLSSVELSKGFGDMVLLLRHDMDQLVSRLAWLQELTGAPAPA
jgi:hypothetical protein